MIDKLKIVPVGLTNLIKNALAIFRTSDGPVFGEVAVDLQRSVVIVAFVRPLDWMELDLKNARLLANLLIKKSDQIESIGTR